MLLANEVLGSQQPMARVFVGEGLNTPRRHPRPRLEETMFSTQTGFRSFEGSRVRVHSPVHSLPLSDGRFRPNMSLADQTAGISLSSEMRQNITNRRSSGRARDSLESTSIPVADLVSRRMSERKKDVDYLQVSKLSLHDRDIISAQSPKYGQEIHPAQTDFDEEWVHLNRTNANDLDRDGQESERDYPSNVPDLVAGDRLRQDSSTVLPSNMDSPSSSSSRSSPALQLSCNSKSMVIWFAYQEDEISAVVLSGSSVGLLIAEAIGVIFARGVQVTPSQVILRFDGQILDQMARISDYDIVSEDTIEVHVLPPSNQKSSIKRQSSSSPVVPRDIFQRADEGGLKVQGDSLALDPDRNQHTTVYQQSASSPVRDIFQPPSSSLGQVLIQPAHQQSSSSPVRDIFQQSSSSPVHDIFNIGRNQNGSAEILAPVVRPAVQQALQHDPSPDRQITYYGVRRGHRVGVCASWAELQRHIAGYPSPAFRAFSTWQDAKDYIIEGMWNDMPAHARRHATPPPWSSRRFDPPPPNNNNRLNDNRNIGNIGNVSNMGRTVPAVMDAPVVPAIAHSQDKIKQNFKCPKFSGNAKDWKIWNKGFIRYLSIWDLDHVLDPSFFDEIPLSAQKVNDNKLVFYILEDATQLSPLAASYIRQAPAKNGFEAYYTLHDGFVFAASTSTTILLNDLANFRFKANETPTELIMRLEELFQELEMLPNGAALAFNDTQRIGYLLGALRHEPGWETVASAITSSQLRGEQTFRQACDELRFRCEADRAYSMMDRSVKTRRQVPTLGARTEVVSEEKQEGVVESSSIESTINALISTAAKRLNKEETDDPKIDTSKAGRRKHTCLAKGCTTKTAFCLCGLHYHSMVSGKSPTLELTGGVGVASYNVTTKLIDYPPTIPKDRMPSNKPRAQ